MESVSLFRVLDDCNAIYVYPFQRSNDRESLKVMKDESNRIETQRSSNLYVQMMDASWKEGINQSVSIAWIIDHCRLSLVACRYYWYLVQECGMKRQDGETAETGTRRFSYFYQTVVVAKPKR
jgi:hypothetical protein